MEKRTLQLRLLSKLIAKAEATEVRAKKLDIVSEIKALQASIDRDAAARRRLGPDASVC